MFSDITSDFLNNRIKKWKDRKYWKETHIHPYKMKTLHSIFDLHYGPYAEKLIIDT
jgi:hypothetical protein